MTDTTAIIFTHRGAEQHGTILADKGICYQVELDDGATLMVQKKHVIKTFTADFTEKPHKVKLAKQAKTLEADSLSSMLTKIRAEGKVATKGKQAKPAAQAKPALAKPTQAKTPPAGDLISLKQLCAELRVEPRIARRRLRNSQGQVGTGSRWEWEANSKELDAIRTAIKG